MTGIVRQIGANWGGGAAIVRGRPVPFLVATALLIGTDMLQWRIGLFDGVPASQADKGLLAAFLVGKLVVSLGWVLAGLRLAHDVATPRLLALSKRQLLWIGGFFLLMPVALVARTVLTQALMPLGLDPRATLLLGILAYLALFLYLQVRLMPAFVGVLLGDPDASLGWSWRATRGLALPFIVALILSAAPLFTLHFGNSLIWLPEAFAARVLVLAFDGAVMAALLLVSSSAYAGLYGRAEKRDAIAAPLPPAATLAV